MYSREFKERTLADLAESGMTVAAFCRQPGRPSRQAVAGWLRLAERGALRVPEPEVRGRCESTPFPLTHGLPFGHDVANGETEAENGTSVA